MASGEIIVAEDDLVLIPEGKYPAGFLHHETCVRWGSPKVRFRFRVDVDDEEPVILDRWYNCKEHLGRPRKNGGFVTSRRHSLYREHYLLFPDDTGGPDPEKLQGLTILVRVNTVRQGFNKKPTPAQSHYSTITELIEVVNGC